MDGGPYRKAFYSRSSREEGGKINFIFILEKFWEGIQCVCTQRIVKQCWMKTSEQYETLLSFIFIRKRGVLFILLLLPYTDLNTKHILQVNLR